MSNAISSKSKKARNAVHFDPRVYLNHVIGINLLLAWKERWFNVRKHDVYFKGAVLFTSDPQARRFAIGKPYRSAGFGKLVFIAAQKDEYEFLSKISISKVVVDKQALCFYIVTNRVMGDFQQKLADFSAMAIRVNCDSEKKLEMMERSSNIVFREMYWDKEEGSWAVNGGNYMQKVPVFDIVNEPIFDEDSLRRDRSFKEIAWAELGMEGAPSQGTGRELQYVDYVGPQVPVSKEFRELVAKFDPSKVPKVVAD